MSLRLVQYQIALPDGATALRYGFFYIKVKGKRPVSAARPQPVEFETIEQVLNFIETVGDAFSDTTLCAAGTIDPKTWDGNLTLL